MQIVIDIPEKYLNSSSGIIDVTLFTGENNAITDVNVEDHYAKFQVLPKGHGDLIDRDTIHLGIERFHSKGDWETANWEVHFAEVVIPADKGE